MKTMRRCSICWGICRDSGRIQARVLPRGFLRELRGGGHRFPDGRRGERCKVACSVMPV